MATALRTSHITFPPCLNGLVLLSIFSAIAASRSMPYIPHISAMRITTSASSDGMPRLHASTETAYLMLCMPQGPKNVIYLSPSRCSSNASYEWHKAISSTICGYRAVLPCVFVCILYQFFDFSFRLSFPFLSYALPIVVRTNVLRSALSMSTLSSISCACSLCGASSTIFAHLATIAAIKSSFFFRSCPDCPFFVCVTRKPCPFNLWTHRMPV